jgi:hypothetical protein
MTLPITDIEQITYLLNTCDETITRDLIAENDPWRTNKHCVDSAHRCSL